QRQAPGERIGHRERNERGRHECRGRGENAPARIGEEKQDQRTELERDLEQRVNRRPHRCLHGRLFHRSFSTAPLFCQVLIGYRGLLQIVEIRRLRASLSPCGRGWSEPKRTGRGVRFSWVCDRPLTRLHLARSVLATLSPQGTRTPRSPLAHA